MHNKYISTGQIYSNFVESSMINYERQTIQILSLSFSVNEKSVLFTHLPSRYLRQEYSKQTPLAVVY